MTFIEIDKQRYRQRLNRVISLFIASFAILSLLFGQVLISAFGNVSVTTGEPTGNLHLNFCGVLLGFAIAAGILYRQRHKAYFKEIYYVSRLKALNNRIYRKYKAIKQAADNNDKAALSILLFYYTSQKQVYLLDDNTLTIDQLDQQLAGIEQQIKALGLTLTANDFDAELLAGF